VRVPPLRAHVEDVLAIGRHFLHERGPGVEIAVDTGYALAAHRWPGNVRELQNVLEDAALRCGGRALAARSLGISRVTLWRRMRKYGVLD
jgi:transcriptional regulator of acetoin/glycerol metabolism